MRVKPGLAAAAAALLLATGGVAAAQQSVPGTPGSPSGSAGSSSSTMQRSTLHEIKDDSATAPSLNINRKDLSGMTIYGSDGQKIGGVSKVLGDESNSVKAVTADVGGFLGMGSREVVIPVDKLKKGADKDRLEVSMTKDELQNLDQWSNGRATGGSPAPAERGSGASPSQPPRQ